MPIALKVLNGLRAGHTISAELPPKTPGRYAFVVVIPVIPDDPELYMYLGELRRGPLREASSITSYLLFRLEHDKDVGVHHYNEADRGGIYDKKTRLEHRVVQTEAEIEPALREWLDDMSLLGPPRLSESSVFNKSEFGGFQMVKEALQKPEEYVHLWQE